MSMYQAQVRTMSRMLSNLDKWLDAGVAHAAAKKFEPAVLLQARLAPDQFPLIKQIQSACDMAKYAASRTAGKEPPKHPDTETSLEEIRARIKTVVSYLDGFETADWEGADKRVIPLSFLPGKGMLAGDYLVEYITPNFLFHVTTAYAILRHNGVPIGKFDYIGQITLQDV